MQGRTQTRLSAAQTLQPKVGAVLHSLHRFVESRLRTLCLDSSKLRLERTLGFGVLNGLTGTTKRASACRLACTLCARDVCLTTGGFNLQVCDGLLVWRHVLLNRIRARHLTGVVLPRSGLASSQLLRLPSDATSGLLGFEAHATDLRGEITVTQSSVRQLSGLLTVASTHFTEALPTCDAQLLPQLTRLESGITITISTLSRLKATHTRSIGKPSGLIKLAGHLKVGGVCLNLLLQGAEARNVVPHVGAVRCERLSADDLKRAWSTLACFRVNCTGHFLGLEQLFRRTAKNSFNLRAQPIRNVGLRYRSLRRATAPATTVYTTTGLESSDRLAKGFAKGFKLSA